MPHLRITLPSAALFETSLSVRVGDINYGGHLGNDGVLSLCQEARLRFLSSLRASEMDFLGSGLIMRDSRAVYRAEAFRGDILSARLFARDVWDYGFEFAYLLTRCQTEIARVSTTMIYFDYTKRAKVKKDPEKIAQFLGLR